MNYIIEDELDFKNELEKMLMEEDDDIEKCLITNQCLETPYIKLCCGHKFNYMPLFNEIVAQKKNFYEIKKLKIYQLKCPYCRNIQNNLLPQRKNYPIWNGVNSPLKFCMFLNECSYKNKDGKVCGVGTNGEHCKRHANILKKFKSQCMCETLSGVRCKNSGSKILFKDKEIILCKIHFKKISKLNFDEEKNLVKYT